MRYQDHLTSIFHKYLNNQCSPAEVTELMSYFRMESDDELLRALILQQLEEEAPDTNKQTEEAAFDRVLMAVSKQIDQQEQSLPVMTRRLPYWTAIAASLLIMLAVGVSLYRYHNSLQPKNLLGQTKPAEIVPGGNKARLTLSNGSVITLDNAKNGQIAKQRNSIIKKSNDGEVIYQPVGHQALAVLTEFNTITTPRGGQYTVVLPDGSKVWLNAASSLKFPVAFTGADRLVELTGEAYFEVAKNKLKPFKVTVREATVEVLGTHFNIMAYTDEAKLRTTLLEGSVRIAKGHQSDLLKPGQQADIDQQNNIRITEADTEQAMAWKNGYFKFTRDNIQTIMRQLSRWYDIDVVYEGSIPNDEFVGKIRRSSNVSEVLRVLQLNNVHFKITNKKIIVTNI